MTLQTDTTALVYLKGDVNRVGILTMNPEQALEVAGTIRVDSLDNNLTPVKLVGSNSTNDLTDVKLGTGLSISNDTLKIADDIINSGDTATLLRQDFLSINTNVLVWTQGNKKLLPYFTQVYRNGQLLKSESQYTITNDSIVTLEEGSYKLGDNITIIAIDNIVALAGGGGIITLQGDVTGSGTNTITTTIGTGKVINSMLAGGISNDKLDVITTAGKVSNSATTATNNNTNNAIVSRDGSGNFIANTITANLSGNATTATTLATGRTLSITGDLTYTSPSFNGSTNVTAAGTLANSGVTANTYTAATITVDAKGRITSASNNTIPTVNNGTLTLAVSGLGLTGSQSFTANQSSAATFTVTSNATNANTPSTIVFRDASGNFSANIITAANGFLGNATSSTNATFAANVTNYLVSTESFRFRSNNNNTGQRIITFPDGDITVARTDAAQTFTGTQTFSSTISGNINGNAATATNVAYSGLTGTVPTWNQNTTGNAATVTTNANLNGDITSVGNTTTIASGVIVNADINASAAIAVSKLAASTISGITLGSNLNTLTISTPLTGTSYNGSSAVSIGLQAATTLVAGSMSAADKTKLDGIAAGAQVNVATNLAQGTRTTTTVPITSSTGTSATLDIATTTLAGVMSSADKTKLDGIASGATANTGTVTSVSGTGTVSGLTLTGTVTTSGNLTLGGTLAVTPSNFASQTANTILAAPNGSAGVPTFRTLVAADIPTLNQNTTGTASNVTGTVAVANGGTALTSIPAKSIIVANTANVYAAISPTAGQSIRINAGNTSWETYTPTTGTVTSVAALTLGTTGTDLSSSVATGTTTPVITLNVPNASASNRGVLTSTDWSTFNGKQNTLTSGVTIKTINNVNLLSSGNLDVQTVLSAATSTVSGFLLANDWVTFNGKQNALSGTGFVKANNTTISYDNSTYLTTSSAASTYQTIITNPITGTGTINYIPKFTSTGSTIGSSSLINDVNSLFVNPNNQSSFGWDYMTNTSNPFIGNNVKNGTANERLQRQSTTSLFYPSAIIFGFQRVNNSSGATSLGGINFMTTDSDIVGDINPITYSRMFIQPSGNIGIGTMQPSFKLDIQGTLGVTGEITLTNLGGSGNRMVVTNNSGLLSTQAIPSSVEPNLYTQLNGPTIVFATSMGSQSTYFLHIDNVSTVTVTLPTASLNTNKSITIKNAGSGAVNSNATNVQRLTGTLVNSILLSGGGKFATLVSDGFNWITMAAN